MRALLIVLLAACGNLTPSGDLSSWYPADGGGLQGGSNHGAIDDVSLLRSCTSTQILKWDGDSWECASDETGGGSYTAGDGLTLTGSDFDVNTGTGIDIVSDAVALNITGASCSPGWFVSSISTTGDGTCSFAAGDVESVNAGNGLTGGGSSGAVSLDVGCSTGLTCNADSLAVDTSAIQERVVGVCSAGSSIRVINGDGTVTCESDDGISGLTTSKVPRATSSTTLGDSQITDDGTNEVKVGAGADAASRTDALFLVTANGDASIAVRDSTNDREFVIATGSNLYVGSSTNHNVILGRNNVSKILLGGGAYNITINDDTGVVGKLTATSTFEAQGTVDLIGSNINLGNGSGDLVRTTGVLGDVGTLPTISSCNSGTRTGGQWSFTVTPGSGTSCTATFATACSAAPTCSVTPGYSTTAINYISSVSTSAVTFNVTGTGWSGSQPVHVVCVCH